MKTDKYREMQQAAALTVWRYGCSYHGGKAPILEIALEEDPEKYGWVWRSREFGKLACPDCVGKGDI